MDMYGTGNLDHVFQIVYHHQYLIMRIPEFFSYTPERTNDIGPMLKVFNGKSPKKVRIRHIMNKPWIVLKHGLR